MVTAKDFDWIRRYPWRCLTVVRGAAVEHVHDVFGLDPATLRHATFDEALDQQTRECPTPRFVVQVDSVSGSVVVVEPNGYLGSDWSRLRRLSEGGQAVSLFWNVKAERRFSAASRGDMLRSFDALVEEMEPVGDPLPEERVSSSFNRRVPSRQRWPSSNA